MEPNALSQYTPKPKAFHLRKWTMSSEKVCRLFFFIPFISFLLYWRSIACQATKKTPYSPQHPMSHTARLTLSQRDLIEDGSIASFHLQVWIAVRGSMTNHTPLFGTRTEMVKKSMRCLDMKAEKLILLCLIRRVKAIRRLYSIYLHAAKLTCMHWFLRLLIVCLATKSLRPVISPRNN